MATRAGAGLSIKPHDYFAAAVAILAEKGSGGLSVSELCGRVGVTSGSLYHHFSGLNGFTDQFLDFWLHAQDRRTPRRETPDEPADAALRRLLVTTIELPHAAEAAFRAWSLNNPRVSEVQALVDRRRHANLLSATTMAGLDAEAAEALTKNGMAMLVGMQLLHRELTGDQFRQAIRPLFCDAFGASAPVAVWLSGRSGWRPE